MSLDFLLYLLCEYFSIIYNANLLVSLLLAGWIGNDAITPIIGAHDPYVHVSGRVGTGIIFSLQH